MTACHPMHAEWFVHIHLAQDTVLSIVDRPFTCDVTCFAEQRPRERFSVIMAGVWYSDMPVTQRTFFHNVTRDGVPNASQIAMASIRKNMDPHGHCISMRQSIGGRQAKLRRMRDELSEVGLDEPARAHSEPPVVLSVSSPPGNAQAHTAAQPQALPSPAEPERGRPVSREPSRPTTAAFGIANIVSTAEATSRQLCCWCWCC